MLNKTVDTLLLAVYRGIHNNYFIEGTLSTKMKHKKLRNKHTTSNIHNFSKYHPIFLRNILNRRTYLCPHRHIKIYLVFHPLPSKIPYPKTPSGKQQKNLFNFQKLRR